MEAVSLLLRMVPPCPPKEHSRLSRTPPRLQLRLPLRRRVDRKRARPLPAEVHAEYCGFEVHLLRFPWYHPGPEAVEPALPELFGRAHDGKRDHGGCRSECQRGFLFRMVLLQAGGR